MNTIRQYLGQLGYNTVTDSFYAYIIEWDAWYKGYWSKFHDYLQYNGNVQIQRRRASLGMAKKVCEDHANLLLNEKVQIKSDNKKFDAYLEAALLKNNFKVRANQLVEVAYALGTGAFVEYTDADGNPMIDYIGAQMIYPLTWDNGEITECAFGSIRNIKGEEYCYVNIHSIDEATGFYVIENKLIKSVDNANATDQKRPAKVKEHTFDGVEPLVTTGSPIPRFQIVTPNIVNNINYDCPMGISVFANAIDVLKGIDLVFDSYNNEFRLGKKRLFIPGAMTKLVMDPTTGTKIPIFDSNDTEFYALPESDGTNQEIIHETNFDLRTESHEQALQRFLNLLSDKCGLGNDRYSFNRDGARTATEVISEKSDMFQNIEKNELILESALIGMAKAIAEIGEFDSETINVSIDFDDSIINDTDAKRARIQLLVTQGKFPLWRYLSEFEGYSEADARVIAAEAESTAPTISLSDMQTPAASTTSTQGIGDVSATKQNIQQAVGVTLNGAQVASLIGVVKSVKAGEISKSAAVALIMSSFGMTEEQANKLLAEDVM